MILTEYDNTFDHAHHRSAAQDALTLLVLEHGYDASELYDLCDEVYEEAR